MSQTYICPLNFILLLLTFFFTLIQLYTEIQPEFVEQHYNELKKIWLVVNNEGTLSNLVWNKAYMHPLIIQGWLDFKDRLNFRTMSKSK
jgi:hypothetical protein